MAILGCFIGYDMTSYIYICYRLWVCPKWEIPQNGKFNGENDDEQLDFRGNFPCGNGDFLARSFAR